MNFRMGIFLWILWAQVAYPVLALEPPIPNKEVYSQNHPDWYGPVLRVADGDTFYIQFYTDKMAVRLKGIDTPEVKDPRKYIQFGGAQASAFTKKLISPGTMVKLSFRGEMVDNFGRLLAFVWYWEGDQWISLQESLLLSGWAYLYTKYPFECPWEYFQYQQLAQEAKQGIWAYPELIVNKIIRTKEDLEAVKWIKKAAGLPSVN